MIDQVRDRHAARSLVAGVAVLAASFSLLAAPLAFASARMVNTQSNHFRPASINLAAADYLVGKQRNTPSMHIPQG